MGFWPVVLNVLKNSDVVLLVLDSRIPEMTRNSEIIKKVELMNGKRLFLVFNKTDLISKKEFERLKKENPNSFFVSGSKGYGFLNLKKSLENMAQNWSRDSLRIGIVGYPNVGKSSVINKLAPNARAKVKALSGTTKSVQWIRVGRLRIQDSPGVIPNKDKAVRVGITASKDPHKLRNPEKTSMKIIEYLNLKSKGTLEDFYGVKNDLETYNLFLEIGKKKNFLVKGGNIDEHRTAVQIIDDWQKGRIKLR